MSPADHKSLSRRFYEKLLHKGSLAILDELADPHDKSFHCEEMAIVRFSNGKNVEHWSVADALTMLRQLGAVPE